MNVTTELQVLVSLVAFGFGASALVREPDRLRHRLLAGHFVALGTWSFGLALPTLLDQHRQQWAHLYLLGACAAPPLGLHLVSVVGWEGRAARQRLIVTAYVLAAVLYVTAWTVLREEHRRAWNVAALLVLATISALALAALVRRITALPQGPSRAAHALLLACALTAALGGMSDLISRGWLPIPRVGPAFLLPYLLVACALVLRSRFFDVDELLARGVVLAVGALAAGLLVVGVVNVTGARILPVALACGLVLALAGPVGRRALAGAKSLLHEENRPAAAVRAAARELARAETREQLWARLDAALQPVSSLRADVHLRGVAGAEDRSGDEAITMLLRDEPVILRRWAEESTADATGEVSRLSAEVAQGMDERRVDALARLRGGGDVVGWVGVGGVPESELTASFASALSSLADAIEAHLARVDALDAARRAEALAAAGELAAGLAHEVRNPVAALRGAAQVVADATEPERVRDMLAVIEEESDRLGRVVGEFLDFARPGEPKPQEVDVGELVQSVLREADAAGLGLETELSVEAGPHHARVDPDQVHRAIANLVRNAREAAGPGGRLTVGVRRLSDRVLVRLEDDGPGVPAEDAERIFQPFFTTREGGTGLGLALVASAVEANGGRVRLETAGERGAAFALELPAISGEPS